MNRGNALGVEDYDGGPDQDKKGLYRDTPFWLRVGPITWAFSDKDMPNRMLFSLYRKGYLAGYQDGRKDHLPQLDN